ncbi:MULTISPECIES: DegT/DnrJ/EryC1/StrS family aminotransferase [unclassified Novosphingobium]|uniref:DegT/DnrJ/EryC1/StrS family aminotransferase n=1 Tax=unclassified Novosphingobium TaxID=2644732 RepID=UPI00146E0D0B|nr:MULTISPECIES: DegT/DnrJ/EryC1/StrS family aminotransferase [unclassified Novosphingobium]NMN07647.1 dTDP-4-amino-4,6-dideoxygalactose transaminase/cation diffusion facilitator CzcD-associated flavoprotein CzcO [Novosphingobium sp. SG919]NMN89951.1 dTDP-4-amino-4,6-dideoxygalactose transaminase/cation diffusion facilitator CzcD-associated flavoprotein CzcO [Novosphingobium sp. SG916]
MPSIPLIAPNPPRLSNMAQGLAAIEARAIFSNGGPAVRAFEAEATAQLFGGQGDCLAVANATLGLILAIRHAAAKRIRPGALALVPAFTFAATAQAAQWAGLTPLIHDVDPQTWASDPRIEEQLLARHGERVAAIVPYAAFGRSLDLDRYAWLARRHGVAVVIDAAASLGSCDAAGRNFGAGAPFVVVYSMHATKTFATAEGGLVHSGDKALVAALRQMTNFGFGSARAAEMPGLNAKLSEVGGLLASAKLAELGQVCDHRAALAEVYRAALPRLGPRFAAPAPMEQGRQAFQFWSLLLPPELAGQRAALIAALAAEGIGSGHYFSPHLGQQPWFQANALIEPVPVSDDLGARVLSLPITDGMSLGDVDVVIDHLAGAVAALGRQEGSRGASAMPAGTTHEMVLIGGGPAGTAMLTAASKQNRLAELAGGLAVVEQGDALGRGELGRYAIRSDSTAETFLSAVKDNVHPELAALVDHPAGLGMARHIGALGAPLVEAGDLLAVTGDRLRDVALEHGARVLTGHAAICARRESDGRWRTTVRDGAGQAQDLVSRHIVLATGGQQCPQSVQDAKIAGGTLGAIAGERLVLSDAFLRLGGPEALRERLADVRDPRIAIVGGSTSAVAAAVLLLKSDPALPLGAGAITLMHRRPLRPFYPSREAALAEGFTDFSDADVCPVSGFVYRLAGLRLEARELVLRMLAVGGRAPDPRLALFQLGQHDDAAARSVLDAADVVIGATGYRPRALPLFDADGAPIVLASDAPEPAPLVDRHCRVRDAAGQVVPGVYGIGLAAGFVPWGPLGGEPSFRGNANGLWLWQNDVGQMIVDAILPAAAQAPGAQQAVA